MHLMLTLLLFMVEVKDEVAMFTTFTGGVEKLRIEVTSAKSG